MEPVYALANKTIVKDRYRIEETLGANGLSMTYKVYDTFREKECVLKELFPQPIVTRSLHDRMQVELVRLSDEGIFRQLADHVMRQAKGMIQLFPLEGIANIITCFEENHTVYVVSEYVEGIPLSDFLSREGAQRLELASLLNFFSPMMDSLQKLHENHIYHGKIRPDQIMVTPKNGVMLIGFGDPMEDVSLPVFMDANLTARDNRYSPVEQFMKDGKLGACTDVYGLAATVYQCITLNEPVDFYDRIGQKDRMRTPFDMRANVTMKQSEVIMKGMASYSFERYQTIGDWLADIYKWAETEEFKEAKPVVLYQAPIGYKQKLRTRRIIAAVAAVAVAIVLLAATPRAVRGIRSVRRLRFYQKFTTQELYRQCEMLKWLNRSDRNHFANDYTRRSTKEEMEPVYYDARKHEVVSRKEFNERGSVYEFVEINFRENNLAIVVFYTRDTTRTVMIDLNNLGAAYQVTELVDTAGKATVSRSLKVDAGGAHEE